MVIPLNGKKPLTAHGLKDATTAASIIFDWWERHPCANVGLPTGTVNGFFVVDVDGPEGEVSLAALEKKHGALPETRTVRTGKGRHLYLKQPPGIKVKSSAGILGPHLDVRGDGGYIAAPPSIHPDTKTEYIITHNGEPADPPPWLVELVREDAAQQKTPADGAKNKKIPYGRRNAWLISQAGSYRRRGDSEETIYEKLKIDYEMRCVHDPPLKDDELRKLAGVGREVRAAGPRVRFARDRRGERHPV